MASKALKSGEGGIKPIHVGRPNKAGKNTFFKLANEAEGIAAKSWVKTKPEGLGQWNMARVDEADRAVMRFVSRVKTNKKSLAKGNEQTVEKLSVLAGEMRAALVQEKVVLQRASEAQSELESGFKEDGMMTQTRDKRGRIDGALGVVEKMIGIANAFIEKYRTTDYATLMRDRQKL